MRPIYFHDVILRLQQFWAAQGCALMQPYDLEKGRIVYRYKPRQE